MTTISINLPDERAARLREIAARFNITLEELARVGIEDLISRPDEAFQRAAERVLTKNAELYRRLA